MATITRFLSVYIQLFLRTPRRFDKMNSQNGRRSCIWTFFQCCCSPVIWVLDKFTSGCSSCCLYLKRCIVGPERYRLLLEDEESGTGHTQAHFDSLRADNEDLRMRIMSKENDLRNAERENSSLLNRITHLEKTIDEMKIKEDAMRRRSQNSEDIINKLKQEKEDALSRLSELMGDKLRDNNPAITNLNDPNRPMKLGDQFSELYENEWTDAFTVLTDEKKVQERDTINILIDILKEIHQRCAKEVEMQLSNVQRDTESASKVNLSKTKDSLKSTAAKYIPVLIQKITHETDSVGKIFFIYKDSCSSYIEKCIQICYFAELQDPPMFIDFEPGQKFDKQCFKEYTKSGTIVDYLVWPAFYLHKDGPLMSKGVVQPRE